MAQELIIGFMVAALRILSAMALSAGAVYSGIWLFDRLTAGIDEWKEMKKGNAAVGILLVSIIASMVLLIEHRILDLVFAIQAETPAIPWHTILLILAFTLANYVLALLGAIILVFLTINIIDRMTMDLDELAELKKGNVAVALLLAASLLLVVFVAREPFKTAFDLLISVESSFL